MIRAILRGLHIVAWLIAFVAVHFWIYFTD